MKKLFKIMMIIFVAVIALAIIGAGVLYFMFPPTEIKTMAQNYVKENYKRELDYNKLSFNLIGVKLTDFKISEVENFSNGTFVEAKELLIKAEFMPLLKGQVIIREVLLNGVQVNIVKEPGGTFNFDSFISQEQTTVQSDTNKTEEEKESASSFGLIVKSVKLHNSSFTYLDKETNMHFGIKNLNLTVNNFSLTDLFTFTLNLDTNLKMGDINLDPLNLTLSAQANLAGLNLENAYINIMPLTLAYKTAKISYEGKVQNFANPVLDLEGKLDGISSKIINSIKPMDLPDFALPAVNLLLKAELDLDNSKATVSQADIKLGTSYINNTASVDFSSENLAYKADTRFNIVLTDIYESAKEMLKEIAPVGNIGGYLNIFSKKSGPEMKGKVMITDVGALITGKELKSLNGEVMISSLKNIKTNVISGVFNNSKFITSLSYSQPAKPINLDLMFDLDKFTLDDINFDEIFAPSSKNEPKEETSKQSGQAAESKNETADFGTYNIKLDVKVKEVANNVLTANNLILKADLNNFANDYSNLQGFINFSSSDGEIRDIDKLMQSSKLMRATFAVIKIIQKVFSVAKLENLSLGMNNTISYSQIEGMYTIQNGLINLDKSTIVSNLLTVKASGNVDMVTEKLNMKVDTHFGKVTSGSGFKPVVLKIKGTMDEPKYSVDVLSTVTSVVNIPTNVLKTGVNVSTNTASGVTNSLKGVASAIGKLF